MHIAELLEAIAPIGASTDPLHPNGLPKTGTTPPPAGQAPAPGATPPVAGQSLAPAGTTPAPGAAPAPAPTLGNQAPMGQPPALQQGMKSTMTDLDKIAAQIVGLKQKQQQMQQQHHGL